jgi:hypothetical protein
MATKEIVNANPQVVMLKAMELATQGWTLSETVPFGLYGWMYKATLEYDGNPPPEKQSRAEILASARAAKAAKAQEGV